MSRKLVAYFSVSGTTAQVAEKLAEAIGTDNFFWTFEQAV